MTDWLEWFRFIKTLRVCKQVNFFCTQYWLDPANFGSSKLVYCDMTLEGKSVYQEQNLHSVWSAFVLAFCEMFSPCLRDFFD